MGFLICKFDEIYLKIRKNCTFAVAVVALFAIGLIIGMVVAGKNCNCWWCHGRLICLKVVMHGKFFPVFLRFLLNLSLLFATLCLLSVASAPNYVKVVISLIIGLFVGSYVKLALATYGIGGFVCCTITFVVLALICLIAIIVSFDSVYQWRRVVCFVDVVKLNLQTLAILLVGFAVFLLATFVVVRLFVVG